MDTEVEGYRDGRDKDAPPPNDNRSPRYKHGFKVGRAEIEGNPIPAATSRKNWEAIEKRERNYNAS